MVSNLISWSLQSKRGLQCVFQHALPGWGWVGRGTPGRPARGPQVSGCSSGRLWRGGPSLARARCDAPGSTRHRSPVRRPDSGALTAWGWTAGSSDGTVWSRGQGPSRPAGPRPSPDLQRGRETVSSPPFTLQTNSLASHPVIKGSWAHQYRNHPQLCNTQKG